MGFANIVFKVGDGTMGWPQHAPFDRIIVTAGAPAVPRQLTDQLAVGGTLLIPAGDRSCQQLEVFHKSAKGVEKSNAGGVIFVPLIGSRGWKE